MWRFKFLLLFSLIAGVWTTALGQNGSVTINADHSVICQSETVHLTAAYQQPGSPFPNSNSKTYTFESHSFEGWTTIDADGDGYNWMLGTELMDSGLGYYGFTGHNESEEIVVSQSYDKIDEDYGIILYPDNYLVSPYKLDVKQGAFIRFYACAQDASWAAEHFGVAISTQSNYNPGDFTTIQQWTLTAKGGGQPAEVSRSGSRIMGNWYQFNVNLNAYVGQQIWVAIRHFNVSDMFYLDIDDITIKSGNNTNSVAFHWDPLGATGASLTVSPSETTTYTATAYKYGFSFASAKTTVWVNHPDFTITADPDEFCLGEESTLTIDMKTASIGDILCSDGSIVKRSDWPVSGKTAKGIVFYVDPLGQHGWAVSLTQQSKKWCNKNTVNVPGLPNYSNWLQAINDMDGAGNTQAINNATTSTTNFPAAAYATGLQGIGGHNWYLPSVGQLNVLFGEILAVNQSIATVGGTAIAYTVHIWSSTECSQEYAMMVMFNNGRVGYDEKSINNIVRAVIDF